MISHDRPAGLTALEAKSTAQFLAFSPIVFQAVIALIRLGILKHVADHGERGATAEATADALGLSEYGVRVLLDMAVTAQVAWIRDEHHYVLDKIGHFLLHDEMTGVNLDFVQDVCYRPMSALAASVQTGRPEGLREFGDWETVYRALPDLPEPTRSSWFRFDHYYSSRAFPDALPLVFAESPARILDVGGNTGLWARACIEFDSDVRVTIADLPEQTAVAARDPRIDTFALDLLDPAAALPTGADVIWMSQFLDCFSRDEIVSILQRAAQVMREDTSLFILETYWDRQRFPAAALSVQATSLYFTCIANGTSRMYRASDMQAMVNAAGLAVVEQHDGLGVGHTLIQCRIT